MSKKKRNPDSTQDGIDRWLKQDLRKTLVLTILIVFAELAIYYFLRA